MDSQSTLLQVITAQLLAARESQQRRLVVLAGERQWSFSIAEKLLSEGNYKQPCWIAGQDSVGQVPEACRHLERQQAKQLLGQEIDFLVYDAWSGLDPDALAAASGSLCSGILLLLVPALEQWPDYADPDYQRLLVHPFQSSQIHGRFLTLFKQSLLAAPDALVIEQHKAVNFKARQVINRPPVFDEDGDCLTQDQARAVAAVIKVKTGHRRRPLVITADRGRGKSAALGIASARLIKQGVQSIIITAPRIESVQPVFERAGKILAVAQTTKSSLIYGKARLQFIAPDELLRTSCEADLLLVDEAAAIPAPMLEQYLKRFSRIVFSSTVHGYEGTGRGFEIRFKQTLNRLTPQWKALTLEEPIRWAKNDPVEQWLFNALLLDAKAVADDQLSEVDAKLCLNEKLNRDQLLDDQQSLKEIFGLLIQAHYQTSPTDLRNLLDGPNISVWVSRFQGHIVAAALLADEGGFDEELSLSIWKSERRPRGHLLPQTLAAHVGLQQAPSLRYQRVMRIAVHPAVQRRGVGQQLMGAIIQQARLDQYDFVGSSFAATADVLSFWRNLQCVPVRLGITRDASSGCYSALVLSALTEQGGELLALARTRFSEQFPQALMARYQQLEPELVVELLLNTHCQSHLVLDQQDWLDIEAFALGYRQYESCQFALWKLAALALSSSALITQLSSTQQQLLVMQVLQHRAVKAVAEGLGFSGKKQLLAALRAAVKVIFLQARLVS